MTTMVVLIGEQTVPNFLPIRHYRPKDVIFVYTFTTKQQYERLREVLQKEIQIHEVETEPYNIAAIVASLDNRLKEIASVVSHPLIFNLTGGTKTMVMAAYQVAQQYDAPVIYVQSEGVQSFVDYYEWHDSFLQHQQQELLPEYLTLTELLDISLGQGKDSKGKHFWKIDPSQGNDGGYLFEVAIAQALYDCQKYEVLRGVKDRNSQVDVDVMILHQNQMGIIEAKIDGRARTLEGVKQLSTAKLYLRGTYIQQFLVINGQRTDDQDAMCKALRINVISLLHYQKGMISLTQEDKDMLLTEINRIMKVS